MFITTKNKRSQIMFRRIPGGTLPPDIILNKALSLSVNNTLVSPIKYNITVSSGLTIVSAVSLRLSVATGLVLSLSSEE